MELLQKQFKAESALNTPLKFEMTNLVAELHCDINLFHATDLFLYPLIQQKTSGFLLISGGIEIDQKHEMG